MNRITPEKRPFSNLEIRHCTYKKNPELPPGVTIFPLTDDMSGRYKGAPLSFAVRSGERASPLLYSTARGERILRQIHRFVFLLLFTLSTSAANAVVLTFDGNICDTGTGSDPCTAGEFISQSYGDAVGVDVTYLSRLGFTNGLRFWPSQYSNLTNVAFGETGGGTAEVFIAALSGFEIVLNSFDLGAWPMTDRGSQWTIRDGNSTLLQQSGPITVLGSIATSVVPGLTSSTGFRIQFGPDSFNVGIDNIAFTVNRTNGSVPEPTTLLLLGVGLLGLGFARQRLHWTCAHKRL